MEYFEDFLIIKVMTKKSGLLNYHKINPRKNSCYFVMINIINKKINVWKITK